MAEGTVGNIYNQAYLQTHEQRMQMAIKMAESEFTTLADRILELEKKVADYERAIAGDFTTPGSSADNAATARLRLMHTVKAERNKRVDRAVAEAEDSFDIARFNVPGAQETMAAKMRAGSTVSSSVDAGLANLGGKGAGKNNLQRIVIAKSLLQAAENAAVTAGKSAQFNRTQQRNRIAAAYGIDPNDMIANEETLKRRFIDTRKKEIDETIGVAELSDADKSKLEAEKTATQEQLDKLRTQMTQRYGEDVDFGQLIERGRQIYNERLGPTTREDRKISRQIARMRKSSPRARQNLAGLEAVKIDDLRITKVGKESDDEIINAASSILEAKKKGRDTVPFELALELLGDDEEKAYQALGLAIRKTVEEASKGDALAREKKKQDPKEADTKDAIAGALVEQGAPDGMEFLDDINVDFDFGDLFSRRVKKEKPPKEKDEDNKNMLESFLDIFRGRDADVKRTPLPTRATQEAAAAGSRIVPGSAKPIPKKDKPQTGPEQIPSEIPKQPFDPKIYTKDNPFVKLDYDDGKRKGTYSYFVKPDGGFGMIGLSGTEVDISGNQKALDEAQAELDKIKEKMEK
mgnify:FL=1